jgi:hypothetical protein
MTATQMTIADFAPNSIWFTSAQYPLGTEVEFAGIVDDETGETCSMEPGDIEGAIPFGFDLEGTVNEAGEWEWDNRGSPIDWHGNSVRDIKGFR